MLMRKLFTIGRQIIPPILRLKLSNFYFNVANLVNYGTTDMFRTAAIETTTICNRKCWYCPNSKYKRPQKIMPTELYKKVIDQLHEIRFKGIVAPHLYGEPLLDKRLLNLISYTRKRLPSCLIKLYSNGDLLTEELFHKLVNVGIDEFLITDHDDEVTENNKAIKREIPVKVFINKLDRKLQNKITMYKLGDKTLRSRGGLIEIKGKKKTRCDLILLVVDYKGDVLLCCDDYFGKYSFGNVNDKHIMDIWNSKNFKSIRKKLRKGIFELDICKKCV